MLQLSKLELKKEIPAQPVEKKKKLGTKETLALLRSWGAVDGRPFSLGDFNKIKNKWYGQAAYVIGTGPTLKPFLDKFGWSFFDGRHTIGINHAIEDYDGFEWFFFLDKRFLDKTTYDLENYKGLIIAQNTTGLKSDENIVTFKTRGDYPGDDIEDGVYSSNLSGLAALHIAVYSGANPIYLVGHGMGASNESAYHYREDYTGEAKKHEIWKKFYRVRTYFDNFAQWRRKIFSVSDYKEYTAIENIPLDGFDDSKRAADSIKIESRLPVIIHLSFSPDLAKHADVTRYQISQGWGIHKLRDFKRIGEEKADLYVLNHFLSTDHQIRNFQEKHRAIDIIHTRGCLPRNGFKKVIAMSEVWKKIIVSMGTDEKTVSVIPACIDTASYTEQPDYKSKTFGRITRWSTGKIPEWWNDMLTDIFEKHPDSKCLFYCQPVGKIKDRPYLEHPQMEYDGSVFIFENKNRYLKNLSFYVHANGFFREISPHGILEAMATGLPIVYLHEDSIAEMIGEHGIACENKQQLQETIESMLLWDASQLEAVGQKMQERAGEYDKEIMLKKYNALLKGCLDE